MGPKSDSSNLKSQVLSVLCLSAFPPAATSILTTSAGTWLRLRGWHWQLVRHCTCFSARERQASRSWYAAVFDYSGSLSRADEAGTTTVFGSDSITLMKLLSLPREEGALKKFPTSTMTYSLVTTRRRRRVVIFRALV